VSLNFTAFSPTLPTHDPTNQQRLPGYQVTYLSLGTNKSDNSPLGAMILGKNSRIFNSNDEKIP